MYRTKVILKSVSKVTNLGNLVIESILFPMEKGNESTSLPTKKLLATTFWVVKYLNLIQIISKYGREWK